MPRGLYVSPTQFVSFAEPNRKALVDHIATRDRSPDFSALGLYLPNPDPILKKMGKDISVYRDLRSDAHTGGCIRRRKAAVRALEWRIERGKAGARITRLVQDVFDGFDMDRIISEVLEATLYGWQPMEATYARAPGRAPKLIDLVGKPPEWFQFDAESRLRFRSRENPFHGELLPERKFIVARQEASYANPYGFADLSMCFWPVTFKRGGLRFWVKFAEKYGAPWAVGKQPRATPPGETDRLLDQLEAMIEDAVAVIPDDASVELIQAQGSSGSADAFEKLLMFCRSEVSIALLGQNQSTEADATHASAKAGIEVTEDLRDGDRRLVEATMNAVIRWIVDLNESPEAPAPTLEMWEEEEVGKERADRDKSLTECGIAFTRTYWKRAYALEDTDFEIAPVTPPGAGGAPDAAAVPRNPSQSFYKKQNGAVSSFGEAGDPQPALRGEVIDPLSAAAAGPVSVWIDRIGEMVDAAPDLDALQQQLLSAFGELPEAELVEIMALGYAAARLRGMAQVSDDAAGAE